MTSPDPSREPSAAIRTAAKALREMYLALMAEGFTRLEAMTIIGHAIASATGKGNGE